MKVVYKNKRDNYIQFDMEKCELCSCEGKVEGSFMKIISRSPSGKVIPKSNVDDLPYLYHKTDVDGVNYDLHCLKCSDAIYLIKAKQAINWKAEVSA